MPGGLIVLRCKVAGGFETTLLTDKLGDSAFDQMLGALPGRPGAANSVGPRLVRSLRAWGFWQAKVPHDAMAVERVLLDRARTRVVD